MKWTSVLAAAAVMSTAAFAANESSYTKILTNDSKCKQIEAHADEGGSYISSCAGYGGMPVYVGEGDLRMFVAYGKNAKDEVAAGQTFGPFNAVGDTIEWRLKDGKPFATILRWKIDGGEGLPKGDMLVVTQLDAGNQCWVGVVAAHKNKDANELARKAADELAGKARCGDETFRAKVVGTPDADIYSGE